MYYDRSVSDALMAELKPDGAFGLLAEFSASRHWADLQLRGYPGKPGCWATLYYGLTKLIDVHERNGAFWLKASKHAEADSAWTTKRPAAGWRNPSDRAAIDQYLRTATGAVGDRFTHEGAVQAMICTRAADLFSVVDREAVIGFENTAARDQVYAEVQAPLQDAFQPDAAKKWWKPKKFGGELDVLAIDKRGRLLTIEVKPGSSTSGIAWAPLQATFYAGLFEAWAAEQGPSAASAIRNMLQQRVDLGLTSAPPRDVRFPLEVVPVVAIGGDYSAAAIDRMREVQHALVSSGAGRTDLEVWRMEETVQCTPIGW